MKSQIFRIVFEDSSLLVIEKLQSFLSQRGDESDGEGLFEFISRQRGHPVLPVHRLDREVLGLMIFAKTKAAAEHLILQFKERKTAKGYEALVDGRVHKDSEHLTHYLKKNEKKNYVTVFPRPTEGAKRADLTYFVLERLESQTRLYIRLLTGRSHQIRVQLAKIGNPIVGDNRYGKKALDESGAPRIQLKSVYLSVIHPISGEPISWLLSEDPRILDWNLLKNL